MKKAIFIISAFCIYSCHTPNTEDVLFERSYSVEINYVKEDSSKTGWRDRFKKDSLHLTCEYYFESKNQSTTIPDSMTIFLYRNSNIFVTKKYKRDILSVVGRDYFNCGPLKDIVTLGIRIDKGKIALIEVDTTYSVIRTIYNAADKKLIVDFLKAMPFYK